MTNHLVMWGSFHKLWHKDSGIKPTSISWKVSGCFFFVAQLTFPMYTASIKHSQLGKSRWIMECHWIFLNPAQLNLNKFVCPNMLFAPFCSRGFGLWGTNRYRLTPNLTGYDWSTRDGSFSSPSPRSQGLKDVLSKRRPRRLYRLGECVVVVVVVELGEQIGGF